MNNPLQTISAHALTKRDDSAIARAGKAANRAAADYIFADYRQRRARKTIHTQTAALLLWVRYLSEVGAVGELLAEAKAWATSYFDNKELTNLLEYSQSQRGSLLIDLARKTQ